MVSTNVVLALVVSKILFSWVVFDVKLPCLNSICNPENCVSIDQERYFFSELLVMTTAMELSQCTNVGGCGCPISSSVSLKIVACLQLRINAPNLASVMEAMMNHRIVHSVKKCPI